MLIEIAVYKLPGKEPIHSFITPTMQVSLYNLRWGK